MTEQEQYETVWLAAGAVADRLAREAVEYDDEDGRTFNLTVATGIVATALLAERKRCLEIARSYPFSELGALHENRAVACNASQNIAAMIVGADL